MHANERRLPLPTRSNRHLRYLSQSVLIEEGATPQMVRVTMVAICAAVVAFLGWASVTEISEITRAQGEVVPTGYVRAVQHLEGGIVSTIHVRNGDLVREGDVLMQLNGVGAYADLQELKARHFSLSLQAERLRAFVNDRAPNFDIISADHPNLIAEQRKIYDGMVAAREGEKRVIENQIAQKAEHLASLAEKKRALVKNADLAREARDIEQRMTEKGVSSQLSYLEREERVVSLEGELGELEGELNRAQQELAEYESRLTSLAAQHRDTAFQDLHRIEGEISQIQETLVKLQNRVNRLEVRSPVDGLVKGMQIGTIGVVVAPGQTLFEIVPTNENLVVEARISPSDIGHTRVGQPVRVKVSAYDYARYGAIDGTLQSTSATTFANQDGERYYLGRVALAQNHVGDTAGRNPVLPGMIVEADIITGGKSILAYLLKPIHVSLSTALTER